MRHRLVAAAAALLASLAATAAGAQSRGFDAVQEALRSVPAGPTIPFVRRSVLSESAVLVGARAGMSARACEILQVIADARSALDQRYRFSDLMMGAGVLPPVIDEARDAVALDSVVMRVAGTVWRISENARLVDVPPTWRDWLLVGLPADACEYRAGDATAGMASETLPANEVERSFWLAESRKAYQAGVQQANDVYDTNLSRLDRAYKGMRRYYDLFAAGYVTAPQIVQATDIVMREDANTLVVGNTLIRITVPVDFVERPDRWRPLTR